MERVAFLIEETGETLGCLLNPESLVIRRTAGIQPRRAATGHLGGVGLSDDPLLHTGGGKTELELDLLFDISVAGSSLPSEDVRDLTRPLWNLAETPAQSEGNGVLPRVRFIWGKAWNLLGVVVAVAERLEQFTPGGVPQRSWLRLRLRRVSEPPPPPPPTLSPLTTADMALDGGIIPEEQVQVHEMLGGGITLEMEAEGEIELSGAVTSERLDELAMRYFGSPTLWRLLASFNDLDDPLHVPPGFLLRVPPLPGGEAP